MTLIQGADIVVQGDLGQRPFILDRDHLDANPGSELTPWDQAWDEFTCIVISISWSWGAGDPLGPLTEAEGGRAQLSLYDPNRAYDPSNVTSPYYLFLRVGMPVRVLVDGAAGWTGTLEQWQYDVGEKTATLNAIDAMATIAALVLPTATLIPAGTTAAQTAAVLDAVSWPAANRTSTGTATASRTDVTVSGQALEALHKIRLAELGALFGTRAGSIAYWARGVTASSTPTIIVNCGGVGLVGLASVFNRGRVRNVVRIDDSLNPYVQVLDASATRHGPRTVSVSNDDLAYPASGRVTAFTAWANVVLTALGQPRPASQLGTLIPVGAAQVDAILRAEWGDVWRIVDTNSSPPIDRTLRVLGQSVNITADTIEVDAVTEDLTGDAALVPPGAPVLVSATPGNAQVTLTWTAPADSGSGPITGYTVTASPGGATCTTTGLSCIVTGLANGTSYSFTVKATNAYGTGPASNALSATPVAPVPNYAATVLATANLVAYWRMGEASGYPQDSKGTNHATVLGGSPTYGAAGATGDGNKAIGFNGSAWFVVPDAAALDVGDAPWTIELWMKRAAFGANFVPWSKGNQGELIWDPSNKLYLGNGSTANTWTTQAITDTNWHHYVFARASNVTGQTKVYIDGVDDTGSNTGSAYAANATPLTFGGRGTLLRDLLARGDVEPLTPTLGFNGAMDEIALYNRALSASEVLAHYNAAPLP